MKSLFESNVAPDRACSSSNSVCGEGSDGEELSEGADEGSEEQLI